ncbi:hypothetical protein DFP72DRAFT_851779 [Ephemerocybe angulata]|uniref:Uncharacterized protein n=1 Tax=Ephemerocybe angulata TaxID=980116 RepID=A0A8H6HNS1_9AGAR|nr:hypothetical protein DFP72DRAFT_851779 [Tulosesus angulatus]
MDNFLGTTDCHGVLVERLSVDRTRRKPNFQAESRLPLSHAEPKVRVSKKPRVFGGDNDLMTIAKEGQAGTVTPPGRARNHRERLRHTEHWRRRTGARTNELEHKSWVRSATTEIQNFGLRVESDEDDKGRRRGAGEGGISDDSQTAVPPDEGLERAGRIASTDILDDLQSFSRTPGDKAHRCRESSGLNREEVVQDELEGQEGNGKGVLALYIGASNHVM